MVKVVKLKVSTLQSDLMNMEADIIIFKYLYFTWRAMMDKIPIEDQEMNELFSKAIKKFQIVRQSLEEVSKKVEANKIENNINKIMQEIGKIKEILNEANEISLKIKGKIDNTFQIFLDDLHKRK